MRIPSEPSPPVCLINMHFDVKMQQYFSSSFQKHLHFPLDFSMEAAAIENNNRLS